MFDTQPRDRRGTVALVEATHRSLLRAEADLARATAHWVDLHGCACCDDGGDLADLVPGGERCRVFGAMDDPEVLEFCVAELAVVQGMHPGSVVAMVADVQDLRFRHPVLWRLVDELVVRVWKAREVARRTRHLTRAQAQEVDAAVAEQIAALSWGRFLAVLDAAVIAADPVVAEERRRAAEEHRFVRTGRTSEHGLATLIARAAAGDVLVFDAAVGRVAAMLAAFGNPESLDVRRSQALGILGNPVRALAFFADYTTAVANHTIEPFPDDDPLDRPNPTHHPYDDDTHSGDPAAVSAVPDDEEPDDEEPDEPAVPDGGDEETVTCPVCTGDGRLDAQVAGDPSVVVQHPLVAATLAGLDRRRFLPTLQLYVHLSQPDLTPSNRPDDAEGTGGSGDGSVGSRGRGVARFEGVGPVTVEQVREFFGTGANTANIVVRPVLDLAGQVPVDAYETPDRLREAMRLLRPGDVFPFAASTRRTLDLDHVDPYKPPGKGRPPGQTRLENLAPLTRFHHRLKTHAGGWALRTIEPGVYLWRTPHGWYYQVDATGTHPLPRGSGQDRWNTTSPPATPSPLETRFALTLVG